MKIYDASLKVVRSVPKEAGSTPGIMEIEVPSGENMPARITFRMKDKSIVRYAVDRDQWTKMVELAHQGSND